MIEQCPKCKKKFFDAQAYRVHMAKCRADLTCPSCAAKDAEIEAAQVLCEIYFEIAAAAIGEEQVRCLRDAAMEQRILRGEG